MCFGGAGEKGSRTIAGSRAPRSVQVSVSCTDFNLHVCHAEMRLRSEAPDVYSLRTWRAWDEGTMAGR